MMRTSGLDKEEGRKGEKKKKKQKKKNATCTRRRLHHGPHLEVVVEPTAEERQPRRKAGRKRIHSRWRGAHAKPRVGLKMLELQVDVADGRRLALDNRLLAGLGPRAGLVQLLLAVVENVLRTKAA